MTQRAEKRKRNDKTWKNAIGCGGLFFLLLMPFVDYGYVYQVSEAREGVVVAEMLRSGEFILPLRNGELIPSKPLMFHWVSSAFAKAFDGPNEWSLRLPSLCAASLLIAFLYFVLGRILDRRIALAAVIILSTCYGFFRLSLDGRVDMLFCFFAISAILFWLFRAGLAVKKGLDIGALSRWTYCVCGLLSGLAVLTKGPLGLLMPILVLSGICIATYPRRLWNVLFQPGWILALAIPLPWYYAATQQQSVTFVSRQIIFENVTRFFGGHGIESKPFWFYLLHLFTQGAPWTWLLLVIGLVLCVAKAKGKPYKLLFDKPESRFLFRSSVAWMLVLLVFFSLADGKRRGYLLPLLPAMALAFAVILPILAQALYARVSAGSIFSRRSRFLPRFGSVIWLITISAVLGGYLVISKGVAAEWIEDAEMRRTFGLIPTAVGRRFLVLAGVGLMLSLSGVILWLQGVPKGSGWRALAAAWCFFSFCFVVFVNTGLAVKGFSHSYRFFANEVRHNVPRSERLSFVKKARDESFDSFFFYMDRQIPLVSYNSTPEEMGYYLARQRWFFNQAKQWQQNVQIIGVGGRLADTEDEELVLFHVNRVQ